MLPEEHGASDQGSRRWGGDMLASGGVDRPTASDRPWLPRFEPGVCENRLPRFAPILEEVAGMGLPPLRGLANVRPGPHPEHGRGRVQGANRAAG